MAESMSTPLPSAIAEGIESLKPLPVTATRLMNALQQPEVALADVADIIEHDESVAAEVLRLSSTVAFASRVAPQTVGEAIMRVGTERLLNLAIGAYMQELRAGVSDTNPLEDRLWMHSAATDLAVTAIWNENPMLSLPALVSTAALLHDIGKLLLLRYLDPTYLDQVGNPFEPSCWWSCSGR